MQQTELPLVILQTSGRQYISCTSKECPFNRTCANHETAGDHRAEDGFTPKLAIKNNPSTKDSYICCSSRFQNPIWYTNNNDPYPVNITDLGCGCACVENGIITDYHRQYEYTDESYERWGDEYESDEYESDRVWIV